MSRLPLLTAIAVLVAGPVSAEPLVFSGDPDGYGEMLISAALAAEGGTLEELAEEAGGSVVFHASAIDLNLDGQAEFAVKMEGPNLCDEYGCPLRVFMAVDGGQWVEVFNYWTNILTLAPVNPDTGYADLVTDGGTVWTFDGTSYI